MIQREEFKEKAILVAMEALMLSQQGISPNYVAKKALEYAEAITLEVCGEEIVWPSDKMPSPPAPPKDRSGLYI